MRVDGGPGTPSPLKKYNFLQFCFDELAVFEDLDPPKVGVGNFVVEIHCARYLFHACTMFHW